MNTFITVNSFKVLIMFIWGWQNERDLMSYKSMVISTPLDGGSDQIYSVLVVET